MKQSIANLAATLTRLAFSALIVVLPFRFRFVLAARPLPPIFKDYTDFLLNASDLFLIALLVGWGVRLALSPRRVRWGPWFITAPLVGVTIIGAISAVFSVDAALSLYHTLRLILLDALYLFIVNEISSPREIILPVALQVSLQSVVGIGQFLQHHSTGLQALGELALDPAWQGVSIVWSGASVLLRAYGLTDHPNLLAGCLAFALIVLLFGYIGSSPRWRGALATLFALGALALLLTFSRAAWLALGGGIAFVLALLWRLRWSAVLKDVLALGVAALIVLLPFAWQYSSYLGVRFNLAEPSMFTGANRSIVERDALFDAATQIWTAHPIIGVGLGAFPIALRAAQPGFPFDYQPPHFVLLDVAAETGILGALFYFGLMLCPWVALWATRRRFNGDAASLAMVAVTALLLATMLVGFFDYYTWLLAPGRLWQWMTWGLWAATYQSWIGARRD